MYQQVYISTKFEFDGYKKFSLTAFNGAKVECCQLLSKVDNSCYRITNGAP